MRAVCLEDIKVRAADLAGQLRVIANLDIECIATYTSGIDHVAK
jgi:hypothetical protein